MTEEEKKGLIKKRAAENSCTILKSNIEAIRYVGDWAEICGCSKKSLQKIIRAYYSISAKSKLMKVRYEMIKRELHRNPDTGSYAIAVQVGLRNERELYKFLNRNFDKSFTKLKIDILLEDNSDKPASQSG